MNMYKFQRQRKSNGQYQGTALGDETKNQVSNQKKVIKQNKKGYLSKIAKENTQLKGDSTKK